MNGSECLLAFRSAEWSGEEQMRAFVEQVDGLEPADLIRVLQLVAGPTPATPAGPRSHALRVAAFEALAQPVAEKALFAHYVRALRAASPELREALIRLLPGVNSILEHPALCALLGSPDAGLRAAVAGLLSRIGAKTAFDTLVEMIENPRLPGRQEVMTVLADIGEHRAIPSLQTVLRVGSVEEKLYALQLLGSARCFARDVEGAKKAMALALFDPTEGVVSAALSGLAQIADEGTYLGVAAPHFDSPSLPLVCAAVAGLRYFPSPRAVRVLHQKLHDGPQVVRLAALEVLEAIGTTDVLKPLSEALGHPQIAVRLRAAEALAHLSRQGKLDLARTVVWLLRSRTAELRRLAVELAQSVQDPEGELWPKLLGCLRDEDWWVRERVADALLEMAGPALLRHVVPYLQDPSAVIRQFAVELLVRLKAPDSLGALVRAAQGDADWWVRERAVEGIAVLQDPRAVPYLVDIMSKDPVLHVGCLGALQAVGASAAAEALAPVQALLASPESDVRVAAVRCLGAFKDGKSTGALEPLLQDASPTVRRVVRDILRELKPQAEGAPAAAAASLSFLDQLLVAMAQQGCDDLLLTPGRKPYVTRLGSVAPFAKVILEPERLKTMLMRYLPPKHVYELEEGREADFSYEVKEHGLRFRVNVFAQLGGLAAVFRIVKGDVPHLQALGLPPVVAGLSDLKNGLVLVGGPTGSGKSTTLAALIDQINATSTRHIVTFEDPIEVVHPYRKGLVNQRELNTHTGELSRALRGTLRQDPDVILVGEMRDLPTISFAVSAAETGHLVFGTIHTSSAALTVDRLVNAFPAAQHDQVRALLAGSLRAVVCQYLVPRRDRGGRCLAVEVMLNNEAVSNLIRKGKTFQIPSIITTSRESGMQLMDTDLMRLLNEGKIGPEDAYVRALSKKEFESRLPGGPPPASA